MTLKRTFLLNQILLFLILLFGNILKFIDFKLRTLFIFVNITIISFVLMIYVKPLLDKEFITVNKDTAQINPIEPIKTLEVATNPPETIPVSKIVYNPNTMVNARSFIIFDLIGNKEVFQRDKDLTLPPASLVKMLSVMYFYPKIDLENTYQSVSECNLVEGQKLGFKNNEKVTGKDLIYSSLVFSAGDSICNLYKISGLNIENFNLFAKNLGMINSNFTNFIGLDYPGNFTTSEDMLTLTKEFIKNDLFNEIVINKSYKMENGKVLYNTNKMLFEDKYSLGIKTGTTFGAKENLIYRHKDDSKNIDILIVLLNSGSRYQDIRNIIQSIKGSLD